MARRKPSETPLMRQFLQVKADHPSGIVFFRMGDFYEMFFDDAVIAARALDLTLTSRDKGREDAIPMCGVPHHAGRGYIARLTELGHKVVVVEQTEDPKQAKGLVRREVVQIVTPGVVVDDEVLDPKRSRYLAAVIGQGDSLGLAHLEASTGELRATWLGSAAALAGELARIAPREVLVAEGRKADLSDLARQLGFVVSEVAELAAPQADEELSELVVDGGGELEADALGSARRAAATCLRYARATQPVGVLPTVRLQLYRLGDAVVLDEAAITNLELTQTILAAPGQSSRRSGSLLDVIDRTVTAPGGRLLERWLLYPLVELAPIRRRQDAVEYFVSHAQVRDATRQVLTHIYDLERLAGRASLGVASPRDLDQLRASLGRLPELAGALAAQAAVELPELLRLSDRDLKGLAELFELLDRALADEPPPTLKDGGVIREGFCQVVDENRRLAAGGREAILAIETRERERTGIPNLRVKYNRVFGYYLEVSKSQLGRVPGDYVRKQTVATGERYVTSELAELESKILAAQELVQVREAELVCELVGKAAQRTGELLQLAAQIAAIDVTAALAELAHESSWVRPTVDESGSLDIAQGRHPVVERAVRTGEFVPNDCTMSSSERQILLITGPNMAGKSTYMRQVAQIVILAQMGSFVPASQARIGVVDRVFTRVGAADNLARGESTFMVEMRETAAILAGATRRSLVVLDEVGRGTSTFDGLSIAWAVAEHLHDMVGCRTLFATHYHELTRMEESHPRVINLQAAAREVAGRIVFLRQIAPGGASRSYGIEVGRLAGLPGAVVVRARQILAELESDGRQLAETRQLGLFSRSPSDPEPPTPAERDPLIAELAAVDVDDVTPRQALDILARMSAAARQG